MGFNEESVKAVQGARFGSEWVKPLHGSYCFAGLPETFKLLLTGSSEGKTIPTESLGQMPQKYRQVFFFFIDAFGERILQTVLERKNCPLLEELFSRGNCSLITSQFPSTTAVHVTTIHTGAPIGTSGVCEWYYYESELQKVITALPFFDTHAGVPLPESDLERVFPAENLYSSLSKHGVKSFVLQPDSFSESATSRFFTRGANRFGYSTGESALRKLVELSSTREKAYFHTYFGDFDSLMHTYGLGESLPYEALEQFFTFMEQIFLPHFRSLGDEALLVIAADHGAISMDPKSTCYLDVEFPSILPSLKVTPRGETIAPCGSSRDVFLHVNERDVESTGLFLRDELSGRAEVFFIEELIKQGFFGTRISDKFARNIGQLVVCPLPGESVYWLGKDRQYSQTFLGNHGGLTWDEMVTPLMFCTGAGI